MMAVTAAWASTMCGSDTSRSSAPSSRSTSIAARTAASTSASTPSKKYSRGAPRAVVGIAAGGAEGELVEVELAEKAGPRRLQPGDGLRVLSRDVVRED